MAVDPIAKVDKKDVALMQDLGIASLETLAKLRGEPSEDEVRAAQDVMRQAFADVEADFPEAECGWELDVARAALHDFPAEVRAEVLRREFGLVDDKEVPA